MTMVMQNIQRLDPRLKIAGIMVGSLLAGSVYLTIRRKRRDKKASAFLVALKQEIKPATAGILASDAFDIDYKEDVVKKVKASSRVLTLSAANSYAKQIHDAWGFWDDDEDAIKSVFRSLKDQVQVSQVAKAYYDKYKINLIDEFNSRLSESEVKEIIEIVKELPGYRKA